MNLNPTTVTEMIILLTKIATEHGGDTLLEFQDYDEDERQVDIVIENKINYSNSDESIKKLAIRIV